MATPRGRSARLFLVCFVIGCGAARTSPPASPIPVVPPPPVVVSPPTTSWTFSYAPGAVHYQISRSAAIESQSDSAGRREASTNVTHEMVTLSPTADSGITLIAVVDTFSTTTQGLIGSVQSVELPVQVSGKFAGDSLELDRDSTTNNSRCNPVRSALVSDLHNLLARFPVQLSQGLAWRDSVNASGCQAGIPTTSRILRSFVVSGEANYEGRLVVLIQRSDTIQAHGEGAQQQHPLRLDAAGTGNAIYYLDTRNGHVVRLTAAQELSLTVTTSSRPNQFKQSSRQDFRLLP